MNQKFKISATFLILVLMCLEVGAYNIEGEGICNCSGCDDCENALNDNTNCYDLVKLTANIPDYSGTCINFLANNKIFDCQEHEIDGTYAASTYGILLNGKTGNEVRNCKITGFYVGILLYPSNNNEILTNSIYGNYFGIAAVSSLNNRIAGNLAYGNYYQGIILQDYSSGNTITNNNISSNGQNGIYLRDSSNNQAINNTINSNNAHGIYLYTSSSNNLTSNTANLNSYHGIYLHASSNNNTIINNTANSNDRGIFLYASSNNNIINNNIKKNAHGIFSDISGSVIENNTITSNDIGITVNDAYCSMNYNITPDTVLFYHSSTCPHCLNMMPWVQELEQEGYNFHWAEYRDTDAMKVINACMPALTYDGVPYFGCTSNGKYHGGKFSSITEMRNFAEECKNEVNKSTVINSNFACSNNISDFSILNSSWSSGDNNTCDIGNWNDTETLGCTYACNGECNCDFCDDCKERLTDPVCSIIKLGSNITNHTKTCIDNPENFNNKTFDCGGYEIDGDGGGSYNGIYLNGKSGNTIKNCITTDFYYGIWLQDSLNISIINNTANSNDWCGICLKENSSNNKVSSNTANSNDNFGIYLDGSSNNSITFSTANLNNWSGIYLSWYSSNNLIINNIATLNDRHGFWVHGTSTGNIINSNYFCNNNQVGGGFYDIYDYDATTGQGNTCDTTNNYTDAGEIGCSCLCRPDFIVTHITRTPRYPNSAGTVNISAAIKNLQNLNLNLSSVNVSLFVDDNLIASKILNLTNIAGKEVNFTWNAETGEHNITIKIDPQDLVDEANSSNNELTQDIYVFPENIRIIDKLSDNSYGKELLLDENQTSQTEYIKIPKNTNIALAEMNLTGLPYRISVPINEIDAWKSSEAWIPSGQKTYCRAEDTYCWGYINNNEVVWSKLIFNSSKVINLTKLNTHTTHTDYGGSYDPGYSLTICETNRTNASDADCNSSVFVLVWNEEHETLVANIYDSQKIENSYLIQPGKKYIMTWKPIDTTTQHAIARKIDSVYYKETTYPENATLDIGNNSLIEWGHPGIFNTTETLELKNELNELLKYCNCSGCVSEQTTCEIPLVFNLDAKGVIKISDIFIKYLIPEKPDFKLENLTYSPSEVWAGENITINAKLRNSGNFYVNSSKVNVSLFVDNNLIASKLLNLTDITETEIKFSLAFHKHKNYKNNIKITVDPNDEVNESDEDNNEINGTLNVRNKCDFNRDGIIIRDWNDLMAAYKCFLGVERNCDNINYQDWTNMKKEYLCFVGN